MELIEKIRAGTFAVFIIAYLAVAEASEARSYTIKKETCVSDVYQTLSRVSSLSFCGQICLADDKCEAVTFQSQLRQCQLSETVDTTTCTLADDCGTLIVVQKDKVCPVGQSHCNIDAGVYYEFSSTTASWDNAQVACQSNGGELACLDTQEKFDWMYAQRAALPNTDPIYTQKMWIGIRYSTAAGGWVWTNGEPLSYDEWNPGEPNDGENDGNRAEYLNVASSCRFNDAPGGTAFYYICEYQL